MKSICLVVFLLFLFAFYAEASIPKRTSLRFQEVSEDYVGDNMIGNSKLQITSITNDKIKAKAITADKIDNAAIYQRHFSPNSVTAGTAAIDLVHLHINSADNIPAQSVTVNGVPQTNIPDGPESVQPYEGSSVANGAGNNAVVIDNPNPTRAYRIQGKARGPGVILGWYPAQNGHLMRYQSSRALRALTCANVELFDIYSTCGWIFEGIDYACDWGFDSAVWHQDLACPNSAEDYLNIGNFCTQPPDQCNSAPFQQADPQCARYPPGQSDPQPNEPDQCHSYTSVEDVTNPQEGVPVYSPSIERIEIDTEGVVEMAFFGRGIVSLTEQDPEIDIIVVVLLNEQYGA
jgi:hypothetical protein